MVTVLPTGSVSLCLCSVFEVFPVFSNCSFSHTVPHKGLSNRSLGVFDPYQTKPVKVTLLPLGLGIQRLSSSLFLSIDLNCSRLPYPYLISLFRSRSPANAALTIHVVFFYDCS
jgi:hypothetical protein